MAIDMPNANDLVARLAGSIGAAGAGYGAYQAARSPWGLDQLASLPQFPGKAGLLDTLAGSEAIPEAMQFSGAAGAAGAGAAGGGAAGDVGLLSRLISPITKTGPYAALQGGAEGPSLATPLLEGSKIAAGLKGLGYGLAGEAGSYLLRKALPGSTTAEHVLSGAARGAGAGAGLGLLGGPFAEVTSPVGAAIGGAVGGLGGLIFGGKKKSQSPEDAAGVLSNVLAQSGIDQSTQSQYVKYYNVLNTLGGNNSKSAQAALTAVGQMIVQQMSKPATPASLTPTQIAAMQSQTAAFLAPYTQQSLDNANLQAQMTLQQLPNVPQAYRGVLAAGAAQELAASQRLANAYAAQAQLAPQSMAFEAQQSQQSALAAQLQQQALYGQLSGTGTSSGNFSRLLQNSQSAAGASPGTY